MLTPLWGVVVVIAASQVIATELTRYAQDGGFEAPFFVMWVHAALMSVLHPLSSCAGSTPPLSRKKINNSVWAFVVFYVGANYAYVRALEVAPASYVQTIFGTAPAAVTVLARFVLGERLSAQRCFAACGALAGATCLASPWAATTPKNTLLGLLLGEVAVANAALYKVMFARDYGSADSVFVSRFVGHVGIRVFLVGLPVVIALQWAGEEDRPTSRRWGLVVAGGCVDVVYNLAIAIALAIAPSPVYVAVATMLAIPATAVVDALANHLIPAWSEILGALLILASFATLVLEQRGQKTPDAGCKVERLRRLRLELFADEERRLERAERHAAWAIVALRAVAAWRRFARRRVALRKPFLRRAFARLVAVGCWFAVRRWHARAQQALARRGSLVIADTLGPRIAERVAFRKLRSFSELGRRRRADGLANARRRARAIARWRHAVVRGSALRRADARVARRAVAAWRSFVATRPERERKAARRAAEALRVVARRLVRRWDARARGRKAAFQLADLVYDRWLGRLLRRWRDKSNHPEDALRARLQFRRFRRATRQKAADRAIDLYADASRARRGVAKLRSAANRSRAERSLRAVSRAAFAALAARRCLSRLATHAFLCRGRRAADHHFASARLRVALSRLSSKRPRPRFVVVPRRVFATWRAFASRRRERRARIARGFIVRWRKRASRRADSIRRARAFRQEKIDRRAAFLLPVAFHALNTDARARWARRHATDLAARRRAYQLKRDVFRAWATLSRNRQTTTTTSLRIVVDDDLDYAPRQRKPPLPADRPRRMVEYG